MYNNENCACVLSHSLVSDSKIPWTVAHQAPLSVGFPRPKYFTELSFSSPGYIHDPRIEPESPALAGEFSTTEPLKKPTMKTSER